MLKLDMRMARRKFFDRRIVEGAVARARQQALVKSAALVRVIAQRSMKVRKYGGRAKSAPGQPPFARRDHVDSRGNPRPERDKLIRRGTMFVYDSSTRSAVVGPARLSGGGTGAPSTLEFGGTAKGRTVVRRVGGSGEIRVIGGWGGRDKSGRYTSVGGRSTKLIRTTGGKSVRVTFAKLRTADQVARANRINRELFGAPKSIVTVAARPFMSPALREAAPSMPSHWKNTVRAA